jgi:hypothetical protein
MKSLKRFVPKIQHLDFLVSGPQWAWAVAHGIHLWMDIFQTDCSDSAAVIQFYNLRDMHQLQDYVQKSAQKLIFHQILSTHQEKTSISQKVTFL